MSAKKITVWILSLGYLGFLLCLPVLWKIYGESHWLLILLLYLPQIFFLVPALSLLLISSLVKEKYLSWINLGTVFLVLLVFMQLKLHPTFKSPAESRPKSALAVLTYNIYGGNNQEGELTSLIKKTGADIVFLQEAGILFRDEESCQELLSDFPDWQVVYSESSDNRPGELMTLSRYPQLKIKEEKLETHRNCLISEIKVDNYRITLINLHFSTTGGVRSFLHSGKKFRKRLIRIARTRYRQMTVFNKIIEGIKNPLIVSGDFNTPANSRVIQLLQGRLSDCFALAGNGFGATYSSFKPFLWRIDYIFVTNDFEIKSCKTPFTLSSDHLPVFAELLFKKIE